MLSLKWGDALSIIPPGALVVFALSFHIDPLGEYVKNLEQVTFAAGVALLILAVLAGGLIAPPPDILANLKDGQHELALRTRPVNCSVAYIAQKQSVESELITC